MINRPIYACICRRMIALAIFVTAGGMLFLTASSTLATETSTEGSSSKKLRRKTVNSIPYHQLNQQTKDKIADILKRPSVYRQLPVTSIQADPDYFRFLVRYPEVIVNIWQLMGVTKMSTERTGPYSLNTDDGAGTISSLELVYGTDDLHIFYGTGSYEGPVLRRKLTGKCVLVLRSKDSVDANGKPVSTSQLDVFLKIDNATAGLIAKTIQPLVGSTADHNFVESLKFVQRLNETTSKNGPGVQRMGERLKIDNAVRQQFNQVVDLVFQRAINSSVPMLQPSAVGSQYPVQGQMSRPGTTTAPPQAYPAPTYTVPAPHGTTPPGKTYSAYTSQQTGFFELPSTGTQRPGQLRPLPQVVNGYQLPAPGLIQANRGGAALNNQAYPYRPIDNRPVQATYDYSHAPSNAVQPVGGWRPRR